MDDISCDMCGAARCAIYHEWGPSCDCAGECESLAGSGQQRDARDMRETLRHFADGEAAALACGHVEAVECFCRAWQSKARPELAAHPELSRVWLEVPHKLSAALKALVESTRIPPSTAAGSSPPDLAQLEARFAKLHRVRQITAGMESVLYPTVALAFQEACADAQERLVRKLLQMAEATVAAQPCDFEAAMRHARQAHARACDLTSCGGRACSDGVGGSSHLPVPSSATLLSKALHLLCAHS